LDLLVLVLFIEESPCVNYIKRAILQSRDVRLRENITRGETAAETIFIPEEVES
jgi:hypothetical protein